MQDNYKTCIVKMERFEFFVHHKNTMKGLCLRTNIFLINEYKFDYCIISYDTIICFINFNDKTYCINPQHYSTTTSKQVSYIRRAAKVWERKGFERILWL
jgi:hypothetical protein